jgi:aminoglycoside phosphotransferase (APT) family kinase protein
MGAGPLKDAAHLIDQRLSNARFQTIVHGDAKPANFCFQPNGDSVAAVDFQYVGGGCGMKDVAYLLQGNAQTSHQSAYLDIYFEALRSAAPAGVSFDELESEWRTLYPWAVADFQRFLAGWSPSWRSASSHELRLTDAVIQEALST